LPADLAKACEAAGIQGVRTFEQGTGWRRTSIGTISEMEKFIGVLKKVRG
jgi:histidinol-phosphate/aromatic aminotransferase/cobyric acid decarboxylase-like protein